MLDDDMAMFMSEMSDVKPLVSHVAKTAENGHDNNGAKRLK